MEANCPDPNQPPIRILRRPSPKNSHQKKSEPTKTGKPVKTFQEREAEYAQARLRILGSAYPEDEDEIASTSSGPEKVCQNGISNTHTDKKDDDDAPTKTIGDDKVVSNSNPAPVTTS